MADLSRKAFLKAKDLRLGDRITFIDEVNWQQKDFSKARDGSDIKSVKAGMVKFNNEDEAKEFIVNQTSYISLAQGWGNDTMGWIGKTAVVDFVKMNSFGQIKDVLCLKPTVSSAKQKAIEAPKAINAEDIAWSE